MITIISSSTVVKNNITTVSVCLSNADSFSFNFNDYSKIVLVTNEYGLFYRSNLSTKLDTHSKFIADFILTLENL